MDQVVGLIIFGIMAALFSFAKKAADKAESERRENTPRTRPEDLPEETRRMLYGDDAGMPTAQARGAEQTPPPLARPGAPVRPQSVSQTPVRPQPVHTQRPLPRFDQDDGEHDLSEDTREELEALAKRRHLEQSQQASQPRAVQHQQQRQQHEAQQARQRQAQEKQKRQSQEARHRQAQEARQRKAQELRQQRKQKARRVPRRHPQSAHPAAFFANPEDVRKGIIMREILGPPKSLQRNQDSLF